MSSADQCVALGSICACPVRICEKEVSDFCSVLSLADRVFVAGSADAVTVARLLGLSLEDIGFDARPLDTTAVCHVEPRDTVVVVAGPQPDAVLTDIVRMVFDIQAVLLAVATRRTPLLLHGADAAITVSSTAWTKSTENQSAQDAFDFMSLVAIHAVRRNLTRRCANHDSMLIHSRRS